VPSVRRFFHGLISGCFKHSRTSYSQCGEDLLLEHLFKWAGIEKPNYLDVGGYDSAHLSNTFRFYLNGSSGVIIEANPYLAKKMQRDRPQDLILAVGIGPNVAEEQEFKIMSSASLSTFSDEQVESYRTHYPNCRVIEKVPVKILTLNAVISKYFPGGLDFLSIDIENLDYEALSTLDFGIHQPKVICIETLTHTPQGKLVKDDRISALLLQHGYSLFADTFINSIFISKKMSAVHEYRTNPAKVF